MTSTPAAETPSLIHAHERRSHSPIPFVVWLLGFTIFALTTSEFMVAGMMPPLVKAFAATISEIGYLISLYAIGMAVGGPLLTALLLTLRLPNKPALLWLLIIYVAGSIVAASATSYGIMATARVITGVASSACFGVSLAICADLVVPDVRGRASSIVLGGLMLATVLGVPVATFIEQGFGWRAPFWCVAALSALCAAIVAVLVPAQREKRSVSIKAEFTSLLSLRLWAAYTTSGLIIGATFAAFSYFSPIFMEVTGFSPAVIPVLLVAYGAANIIGNIIVGHFADRYTIPILIGGLILLALALITFALFTGNPVISIAAFMVIGLVGVPMNPAMIARVMRAAHPGPLVNTVHTSIITTGLAFGAWAGGLGIEAGYGLTAPLWIGFFLAAAGLLSLAPAAARRLDDQD